MFIFACALINKYDDNDKEAEKNQETIIKLVHIWMSTECLQSCQFFTSSVFMDISIL